MMLLVPCDVLNPRRADDHLAAEAQAARALGHRVGLIDHDALTAGDAARAVARIPADGDTAVYRGWMLTAPAYAGFVTALSARGVTMRTSAEQYRRGHELPGWYDTLEPFTPLSVWTSGAHRDAFDKARSALGRGPAVIRDYTKSMKHYWHEAAYIPELTDADAAWKVARRLHELRGDDFTGGFVLRRFEEFTGAEARTWWIDGTCCLVTAHPDTADQSPAADLPLPQLAGAVAELGLPFVTVDLAAQRDGTWRVAEHRARTGFTLKHYASDNYPRSSAEPEHLGDLEPEVLHNDDPRTPATILE
ncbi:ATP-grasp domain-containing protein [Actinoplanes sp. LDG1-06]|uniref:ATP-grasp domain-containing protein n=1 Tax=Paractinoplanes ovalisporus TaxID=2810368 RepID=A0ABS2AVA5_9ACTN|nr:ATP-grasp domain-containing protein [Actinoplanes ovalisporus]MBM2623807.1 ATP-grasp domain-containing protein [Actinoplanes ovalisporus]